jgi:hypothetical protein
LNGKLTGHQRSGGITGAKKRQIAGLKPTLVRRKFIRNFKYYSVLEHFSLEMPA